MTTLSEDELVSVIIPCYNPAHFLGEAVESVLGQTYPHIEIIVIDDGSTDDIAQVMTAYPSIRYVRQDNMGLSRARNAGLAQSNGAYVVFLDADDHLFPDAVDIGLGPVYGIPLDEQGGKVTPDPFSRKHEIIGPGDIQPGHGSSVNWV